MFSVDEVLDGLAGDHLVEVAEPAHQLTDLLPIGEDLLLRPGEFGLRIECALAPGRLDPLVFLMRLPVMLCAAGGSGVLDDGPRLDVLVTECGRHRGSLSDGSDGQASAFAAELAVALCRSDSKAPAPTFGSPRSASLPSKSNFSNRDNHDRAGHPRHDSAQPPAGRTP